MPLLEKTHPPSNLFPGLKPRKEVVVKNIKPRRKVEALVDGEKDASSTQRWPADRSQIPPEAAGSGTTANRYTYQRPPESSQAELHSA